MIFVVVCRDFIDYTKSCHSPSLHGLSLVGLGTKCHTHLRCVIKLFEHSEAFSVHDARRMWPGIIDGKKDAHSAYLVQSGFMTLLFLVHSAQVERIRGQLDAVTDARGLQQLMRHLPLILLVTVPYGRFDRVQEVTDFHWFIYKYIYIHIYICVYMHTVIENRIARDLNARFR